MMAIVGITQESFLQTQIYYCSNDKYIELLDMDRKQAEMADGQVFLPSREATLELMPIWWRIGLEQRSARFLQDFKQPTTLEEEEELTMKMFLIQQKMEDQFYLQTGLESAVINRSIWKYRLDEDEQLKELEKKVY